MSLAHSLAQVAVSVQSEIGEARDRLDSRGANPLSVANLAGDLAVGAGGGAAGGTLRC